MTIARTNTNYQKIPLLKKEELDPLDERVLTAFNKGVCRLPITLSKAITSKDGYDQGIYSKALIGHTGGVFGLTLSKNGQRLLSTSLDGTVKVWNVEPGKCILSQSMRTFTPSGSNFIAFAPDEKSVASAGSNGTIQIWNMASGACILTLAEHSAEISSICFTPDGEKLISTSFDTTIKIWDMKSRASIRTLRGHKAEITTAILTSNGKSLISGGGDGAIKIWDVESDRCTATLEGNKTSITSLATSLDEKLLISGSCDGAIKIWNLDSYTCAHNLTGHKNRVSEILMTPDKENFISASFDNTIRIWNLKSGKCIRPLTGHTKQITTIAINPNGKNLVSGSYDHTIRIWDIESGECLHVLEKHTEAVYKILFTSDGKGLISASEDGIIRAWSQYLILINMDGGPRTTQVGSRMVKDIFSEANSFVEEIYQNDPKTQELLARGSIIRSLINNENRTETPSCRITPRSEEEISLYCQSLVMTGVLLSIVTPESKGYHLLRKSNGAIHKKEIWNQLRPIGYRAIHEYVRTVFSEGQKRPFLDEECRIRVLRALQCTPEDYQSMDYEMPPEDPTAEKTTMERVKLISAMSPMSPQTLVKWFQNLTGSKTDAILNYFQRMCSAQETIPEAQESKPQENEEELARRALQDELLAEEAARETKKKNRSEPKSKSKPAQVPTPKQKPTQPTQTPTPRQKPASPVQTSYHDPHFDSRPGVRTVPAAQLQRRVVKSPSEELSKYLGGAIATSSHVQRWKEIQSLEAISSFPDLKRDKTARRYANMNDVQLQEQLLRHDSSGIEKLLASTEFMQKYAVQTPQGYVLKVQLSFPGAPPTDWSLATVAFDAQRRLCHFFCHKPEELVPRGETQEDISAYLFRDLAASHDLPESPSKPASLKKVGQQNFAIDESFIISIQRTHPAGLESTLSIAPATPSSR